MLQECSYWAYSNGALQMFFSDTYKKHGWKICQVSGFLAVLWENIFYNAERVQFRKVSEVF